MICLKGLITDIQRFSLNDGEGIRTTVFFKGCNMRCSWCHNPETISFTPQLLFYENKCIGCGKCFAACPQKAHKMTDTVTHFIKRESCVSCGLCAKACYSEAISICGKEYGLSEIMEQIYQDKAYYKSSGGGVTLSGGEVLCNLDFAMQITDACHNEGIDVAIETNMNVPFEKAVTLFKKVDFIMCDLKIFNDAAHILHTGVSNKTILANISALDGMGIPFVVRTPLVPGITDSTENLWAIANFIKSLKNLKRYELLNFNPLGVDKYKGLNMENAFENKRPLSADKLSEISQTMEKNGIKFRIV